MINIDELSDYNKNRVLSLLRANKKLDSNLYKADTPDIIDLIMIDEEIAILGEIIYSQPLLIEKYERLLSLRKRFTNFSDTYLDFNKYIYNELKNLVIELGSYLDFDLNLNFKDIIRDQFSTLSEQIMTDGFNDEFKIKQKRLK